MVFYERETTFSERLFFEHINILFKRPGENLYVDYFPMCSTYFGFIANIVSLFASWL